MLRDYIASHLPPSMSRVIDPADVLQGTFVEAWRRAAAFQPDGKPDPFDRWLLTIAQHQIIEQMREWDAAWRGRDCSDAVVEALEQLAVYRRTPSQSFYSLEVLIAIEGALGRLPEDQGTAVRLRHLEEMTWTQVAAQMKRTPAAVRQLRNRGLLTLRGDPKLASFFD